MSGRHRKERNPVVGHIKGRLDTGQGSKKGHLLQDEIDAMEARTERLPRFRPAAKLLDESRGSDPLHKRYKR